MSIAPIITFKAGLCELNTSTSPSKVKPLPDPGYIYLYSEDDLIHFCWRPRSAPLDEPKIDLVMVPTDGTFQPYEGQNASSNKKLTNGRIFVLKFTSSSRRDFFWLQSRSQHASGTPSWFSPRDLRLGQIVDTLLQGEEVDVEREIANLPGDQGAGGGDDDATMEDVEGANDGSEHYRGGSGGAEPGATGGDVREEGEESREGGADGGRAAGQPAEAQEIIQNFLRSIGGNSRQSAPQEKLYTTLADLLTPISTIPLIDDADEATLDRFLEYLPPGLIDIALGVDEAISASSDSKPSPALNVKPTKTQKQDILKRVLRSPQFSQSLATLTIALRDGGLPSISEALNVPVKNGGFLRRGGVPLGGGDAVEAFVEGVQEQINHPKSSQDDEMDTGS